MESFDVVVVGAGPAGSVAALVLARGGARVALVDRASFPRDKACGDLVGPRGVRLLADLRVGVAAAERVTGMVVVGPTGRAVHLPPHPGRTYAGHGIVVPRAAFDAALVEAATAAGAVFHRARAVEAVGDPRAPAFRLSDRSVVRGDVVVGADGAVSTVADAAGLVDPPRSLWALAVRGYVDAAVGHPTIVVWEPRPWQAFPGYGWLFPGPGGRANVGLGIAVLADRSGARRAPAALDGFVADLRRGGWLPPGAVEQRRGGWLRLGLAGVRPAEGRVLLVGDAAGLVNPLQGEGISEAMASGKAAAEAILAGADDAAGRYLAFVAGRYGRFHAANAAVHAALLPRPRLVSAASRVLTAPGVSRALASGWAVYWNELLDGARPSRARTVATVVDAVVAGATAKSRVVRGVAAALRPRPVGPGRSRRRNGPVGAPTSPRNLTPLQCDGQDEIRAGIRTGQK